MAAFVGDLSSAYIQKGSLWATSTGVTTDANAQGASVDAVDDVANVLSATLIVGGVAGTGTPTLSVKVQASTDGSSNWTDVDGGTFTAVSTTQTIETIPIKPKYRYLRTTGTLAGTNPVFEATTIFQAPRTTAPANSGGFSQSAAGSV